jgi:hypothetical protein
MRFMGSRFGGRVRPRRVVRGDLHLQIAVPTDAHRRHQGRGLQGWQRQAQQRRKPLAGKPERIEAVLEQSFHHRVRALGATLWGGTTLARVRQALFKESEGRVVC